MTVYVLLRASKKTGKVDTCMTGLGSAMMQFWALEHTPKTKRTLIFNQDTGAAVYIAEGREDWPEIKKTDLGHCWDYGIALEDLQSIKDERF